MSTRRWFVFVGAAMLLLPGCALVDVNLKPPDTGLKTPIPGGKGRQVIVATPFTDARTSKDRCGVQKGGFGNETAKAVCQGEPTKWISDLLTKELQASGFSVLTEDTGAKDTALRIEGVLVQIFAEPIVGFWSTDIETDLGVDLVATSRTGLRAERRFYVKGELTSVIWTQGLFNDSAEKAIREMLARMVNAILELMAKYPELGFERQPPARALASTRWIR